MDRIPVGSAIAHGYRFLIVRLVPVLGLSWLPGLLLGLAIVTGFKALDGHFYSFMHGAEEASLLAMAGDLGLILLATLFLGSAIAVPLAREAAGFHDERVVAHFVVGIREVRLFFASLRFVLLIAGALILLGFVSGLAVQFGVAQGIESLLPGKNMDLWPSLAGVVINAIAALTVLVIAVRSGFFLVTIAAREPGASLRRAATLANRNHLRLVAILLGILAPVVIACLIALPFSLPALIGADFGQALDIATAHATQVAAILVSALVVALALLAGASTTAYEALTQGAPAADDEVPAEVVRTRPRPAPGSHEIPDVPGLVTASAGEPQIAGEDKIVPREELELPPSVETTGHALVHADEDSLPPQAEDSETKDVALATSGEAVHPLATLLPVDAIVLDNIGNGAAHSEGPHDLREQAPDAAQIPHVADVTPQAEQPSTT